MSRAREVSKSPLIITSLTTSIEEFDAVAYSSASPSGAQVGDLWVDTSIANPLIKAYDGTTWDTLGSAPMPLISEIDPENISGVSGSTIHISGQNFDNGSLVYFIGTDNIEKQSSLVTYQNSSLITAVNPTLSASAAPYSIKVRNLDNSISTLSRSLDIGTFPLWQTSSGNLNTINDIFSGNVATLTAVDPNQLSVSYESSSIPSGLSLNTGTGIISGNPADVASNTTYSFDVTARNSSGLFNTRNFNIIVNKTDDGSSSSRAAISGTALYNLGLRTSGIYWITAHGRRSAFQAYIALDNVWKGSVLVIKQAGRTLGTGSSSIGNGDITSLATQLGENNAGEGTKFDDAVIQDIANRTTATVGVLSYRDASFSTTGASNNSTGLFRLSDGACWLTYNFSSFSYASRMNPGTVYTTVDLANPYTIAGSTTASHTGWNTYIGDSAYSFITNHTDTYGFQNHTMNYSSDDACAIFIRSST
jgi:hypothetical protein